MLQDKIGILQREFDRFKINFQNELDNLKASNNSKIKLDEIYRLICNTRATGFEPQKIVISPDVDETIWDSHFTKGYSFYLFGIPLEIKTDGYNEITIISKKIDG
jgi:hypothetical protein